MKRLSKITVEDGVLSKRFTKEEVFKETLLNSLEADEVSKVSSVFRAPRVVNYEKGELVINYEYLPRYAEVHSLLRDFKYFGYSDKVLYELFFNIGYGLAEYHLATNKIHGDFDPSNVLYEAGNNKILYIDFSRPLHADYAGYNKGSIYKDLVLFVIFTRTKYPILKSHYIVRKTNVKLCVELLKGYFSKAEHLRFSPSEFEEVHKYFMEESYLSKYVVMRIVNWSNLFNSREWIYELEH